MQANIDQNLFFPSEIVTLTIEGRDSKHKIKIPKREIPTVGEIFEKNEYAITGPRFRTGPMTVMDIGANVGLFALYMKLQDTESIIHCFEPSPPTLALLQSNVGHIPGIHIHPYGLYNRDDETDFYLHGYNTGENSIKRNTDYFSHSVKVSLRHAGSELNRLAVSEIDILKIDTEGCEVEIIECIGSRLQYVDYVMLEYHTEVDRRKIDNLLKDFHVLASHSDRLGFGVMKYINARLVGSYRLAERGPGQKD